MKLSLRAAIPLVLLFPAAAAGRSAALPPLPVGRSAPALVRGWKHRFEAADTALRAGEWKKARKISDAVLREMRDSIVGGESEAVWLAAGAFYRGLAEAGLGDRRNGRWDFGIALSFDPRLRDVDLSPYGPAGETAAPWRQPGAAGEAGGGEANERMRRAAEEGRDLAPPVKLHTRPPKFPRGKGHTCIGHSIAVQAVIDEHGRIRHPVLLTKQEAVLGFAVLDALRDWRFRPARIGGQPVSVSYNLAVAYDASDCGGPMSSPRR